MSISLSAIVLFFIFQYRLRQHTIQKVDTLYQYVEFDRSIDSLLYYNNDKQWIGNCLNSYKGKLSELDETFKMLSFFVGSDSANNRRMEQALDLIGKREKMLSHVNKQTSDLVTFDSAEVTPLIKIEPLFNTGTGFSNLVFKVDSTLPLKEVNVFKVRSIRNSVAINDSSIIFERDYFPNDSSRNNITVIPNPYFEDNVTLEVGYLLKNGDRNYKYSQLKIYNYAKR